jgi:hypothetical protein
VPLITSLVKQNFPINVYDDGHGNGLEERIGRTVEYLNSAENKCSEDDGFPDEQDGEDYN